MNVGTLEEIIDDDHAIVSSSNGPEYYVSILSFVDKDILEPGCSVLVHHKVHLDGGMDAGGVVLESGFSFSLFPYSSPPPFPTALSLSLSLEYGCCRCPGG